MSATAIRNLRSVMGETYPIVVLFCLQALVAIFVFPDFLFAKKYLAFRDIGSDSFSQIVPMTIHLARELQSGWPDTWSFNYGMGSGNSGVPNLFFFIGAVLGPEGVLPLRVWAYLLRLVLAGFAFYWLLRLNGSRRLTAIVCALSYSFCGFATVDGQWDGMSFELVFYPLVLAGLLLYLRKQNFVALPVFVALAIFGGTFVFSLGLFFVYLCIAFCALSDSPKKELKRWILGVFPLFFLGLALAGPSVLHTVFQILDSPRVTGNQSLVSSLISKAFSFNDSLILRSELAAFFHKDILGIGSYYTGWKNYFEGPMFYVGILPLLLIPHLWYGTPADRKHIAIAGVVILAFLLFPAVRFATYGFAVPYFRVNNLWITLILLLLAARALDIVLDAGIKPKMVVVSAIIMGLMLFAIWRISLGNTVRVSHVLKMFALIAFSVIVLFSLKPLAKRPAIKAGILLFFTVVTSAWVTYPSFNINRNVVMPHLPGYVDETVSALRAIRAIDTQPFFRIEKNFNSVSLNDAIAQDYFGVKSYDFQGAAIVRFYIETGLIPRDNGTGLNYTNWLPNFGQRFALNTLVGVKYILSRETLNWPGFNLLSRDASFAVYENSQALPLGVVYDKQILARSVKDIPDKTKDLVMLRAAIVDSGVGESPQWFYVTEMTNFSDDFLAEQYFGPAKNLRQRGLKIDNFSQSSISGTVDAGAGGVLAFTVPDVKGWSIEVDGAVTPHVRVNFGFIGVPIESGEHRISLRYRPPGLVIGLVGSALSLMFLVGFSVWSGTRRRAAVVSGEANQTGWPKVGKGS